MDKRILSFDKSNSHIFDTRQPSSRTYKIPKIHFFYYIYIYNKKKIIMKHIKTFEGFSRIKPAGGLSDLWYKITHPFLDYSQSGMGTARLVDRKLDKEHKEKYKNEPVPTGTNASDCVGTLDYKKSAISDKISSEILSKLESAIYNIESVEKTRDGFLFKLKELPNLWLIDMGPTDCDFLINLLKDGKYIEKTDTCGGGATNLIKLYHFIKDKSRFNGTLFQGMDV